jgi:hypothetical protein
MARHERFFRKALVPPDGFPMDLTYWPRPPSPPPAPVVRIPLTRAEKSQISQVRVAIARVAKENESLSARIARVLKSIDEFRRHKSKALGFAIRYPPEVRARLAASLARYCRAIDQPANSRVTPVQYTCGVFARIEKACEKVDKEIVELKGRLARWDARVERARRCLAAVRSVDVRPFITGFTFQAIWQDEVKAIKEWSGKPASFEAFGPCRQRVALARERLRASGPLLPSQPGATGISFEPEPRMRDVRNYEESVVRDFASRIKPTSTRFLKVYALIARGPAVRPPRRRVAAVPRGPVQPIRVGDPLSSEISAVAELQRLSGLNSLHAELADLRQRRDAESRKLEGQRARHAQEEFAVRQRRLVLDQRRSMSTDQ